MRLMVSDQRFSPYSRGWSPVARTAVSPLIILPVFAGMVHEGSLFVSRQFNSPRIRGDGPIKIAEKYFPKKFSPYSRGWSRILIVHHNGFCILPVFAGMVP